MLSRAESASGQKKDLGERFGNRSTRKNVKESTIEASSLLQRQSAERWEESAGGRCTISSEKASDELKRRGLVNVPGGRLFFVPGV